MDDDKAGKRVFVFFLFKDHINEKKKRKTLMHSCDSVLGARPCFFKKWYLFLRL